MKPSHLLQLFILFGCAFVKVIYCYQDYTDVLKSVALYYYNPFYNAEQQVKKNCVLNNFSVDLPTKVIIHGYIADRFHSSIVPIKNAYLIAADCNVIVVDWSQGAYQPYDVSRGITGRVAARIGDILDDLIYEYNLDKGSIHIIGHSLGAHIAGCVGRYFHGELGRITALDAAQPLYLKWSLDAVKETDGRFVDVIHTCGEALGEIWPRGHIDFYPNNGLPPQPGCNLKDALTLFSCSHFRASEYFAESILLPNSFVAVECVFSDILARERCTSRNMESVIMGEYVPREARGTYFLRTYAIPPYGRGNNSELFS